MNRSQWTKAEIEYLRMSYRSGKRIKVIANEINRSEMGVNKALRRFNIRPQDERKAISQKTKVPYPPKLPQTRIREPRKKVNNDWISIPKMVRWMTENGINVIATNKFKMRYKINHIPSTLGQLLLICNRLRLANNLPIFRVKDITDA